MAHFAVLLLDATCRARVDAALRVERSTQVAHRVTHLSDWAELYGIAQQQRLHVAIFDPYARGNRDVEACGAFHQRFPSVALIPYGCFEGHPVQQVLRLAEVGVRHVVCRDNDDASVALRATLLAAVSDACAVQITMALGDGLPPAVGQLLNQVVTSSDGGFRPEYIARVHYCHEKTLRERLRAAGLPPTNKLVVWLRLLHAACLLGEPGRSVESVALALNFPSASALHKQMLRYVGTAPRDLVSRGGLTHIAGEFRRRLNTRSWHLYRGTTALRSAESDSRSSEER